MSADFRDLYYAWERDQWEAVPIELAADRAAWETFDEDTRASLRDLFARLSGVTEQLSSALVPLIDAAPTEEQQVFLTTQLVDVARHAVFLDRWRSEVAGEAGDMQSRFGAGSAPSPGRVAELIGMVEPLRQVPTEQPLFRAAIQALHRVIDEVHGGRVRDSIVGLVGADALPGSLEGLALIARDQTRHLTFAERVGTEATAGSVPHP